MREVRWIEGNNQVDCLGGDAISRSKTSMVPAISKDKRNLIKCTSKFSGFLKQRKKMLSQGNKLLNTQWSESAHRICQWSSRPISSSEMLCMRHIAGIKRDYLIFCQSNSEKGVSQSVKGERRLREAKHAGSGLQWDERIIAERMYKSVKNLRAAEAKRQETSLLGLIVVDDPLLVGNQFIEGRELERGRGIKQIWA